MHHAKLLKMAVLAGEEDTVVVNVGCSIAKLEITFILEFVWWQENGISIEFCMQGRKWHLYWNQENSTARTNEKSIGKLV